MTHSIFAKRQNVPWKLALVLLAQVAFVAGTAAGQNIISFNYATASGTATTPNNLIGAAETAGASGFNAANWNNLLTDWGGNGGAVPSPLVYNDGTTVSGLGIAYDSPNAWNNGIGTTTGDLKLMRNYLDSGNPDSPYAELSNVPFRKFDVVLYADGDGTSNVIGPYVLRYGTGSRQAGQQAEADTNVTNLLRPVVWGKESGNFSGSYTAVNTNTALSVAAAGTGNYMVFPGIKGNFTIDPTQTTGVSRAPLNGFQVVRWETTNAMPGADDATAKVALYSGNVTVSANRTIGSLATSVGTYGDLIINSGVTLTLANGDLDIGDISHWVKGGGNLTSSTNTLTINRDVSAGYNYAGGSFGATDAAVNGANLVDNGGNALNVVKTGGGNLRIANSQPYSGTTTISQGSLEISHAQALGNAASTLQINDATTSFFKSALYLANNITLSRNISVNNQGRGTTTLGTLSGSGTHTFSGNITLGKSATLSAPSGGTVNFGTGILSGAGGIVKADAGTVSLNSANTFTGTTTVNGGTLNLLGTGRIYATGGFFGAAGVTNVIVNSGGTLVVDKYDYGAGNSFSEMRNNYYAISINGGTLRVTGTNTSSRAFTVGAGGATIDVPTGSTFTKSAGSLGSQNVIGNAGNNALTLTGGGTGTIADDLGAQGTWTTAQVVKSGSGTWTLSGTNTYGGATTISGGTLFVMGTHTGGLYTVGDGSGTDILGGTGAINAAVNIAAGGGVLAPGLSPGVLTINGNVSIAGQLQSELTGSMAGTGYDQLRLSNSGTYNVALGGTLDPQFTGNGWSSATDMLWIINNESTGALSGVFSNYATNGQLVTNFDNRDWFIHYGADFGTLSLSGGNDVVLTPVPEPGTLALLALGMVPLLLGRGTRRRG